MSQTVHDIGEGSVLIGKSAHQGALAHAEFSSNDLDSRLASGKKLDQSPLQPVNEIRTLLRAAAEYFFGVCVQNCEKPVISGSDRCGKLLSAEDDPLVALAKLHRASEKLY
ncbi:hypothetical protein G5V57_10720 [Nordella sp. HKS 07]|nr:hypothetical protein [Nordella sp. HKS 07]QIG46273.1 hypothetical protein G5V57_10720 [Nordella sp. HKS 07]